MKRVMALALVLILAFVTPMAVSACPPRPVDLLVTGEVGSSTPNGQIHLTVERSTNQGWDVRFSGWVDYTDFHYKVPCSAKAGLIRFRVWNETSNKMTNHRWFNYFNPRKGVVAVVMPRAD